jgi:hypothetical protein
MIPKLGAMTSTAKGCIEKTRYGKLCLEKIDQQ